MYNKKFLVVCTNDKRKRFGFMETNNKAFATVKSKFIAEAEELGDCKGWEVDKLLSGDVNENAAAKRDFYENKDYTYVELTRKKKILTINAPEAAVIYKAKNDIYVTCLLCKKDIRKTSLNTHNKTAKHEKLAKEKKETIEMKKQKIEKIRETGGNIFYMKKIDIDDREKKELHYCKWRTFFISQYLTCKLNRNNMIGLVSDKYNSSIDTFFDGEQIKKNEMELLVNTLIDKGNKKNYNLSDFTRFSKKFILYNFDDSLSEEASEEISEEEEYSN